MHGLLTYIDVYGLGFECLPVCLRNKAFIVCPHIQKDQKPRHIKMRYGKEFKKACRYLGIKGKTLHNLRDTYAVRRWAITGDIKMVADEIGHASVVMTDKYAKFNLRKLRDDFPSLKDRINLRLTPPSEDKYFTNLLNAI